MTNSITSSVKFQFSGRKTFFDNDAAYTGFRDQKTGAVTSWYATAGTYNIAATGYTADNGAGTAGNTLSISIKFV